MKFIRALWVPLAFLVVYVPLSAFPLARETEVEAAPVHITITDVYSFLNEDDTDNMVYSENFNCVSFSETLIERAREKGFVAVYVSVWWPEFWIGHTFVAFHSEDEGIIWIEPQNDREYVVVDFSKPVPYDGDILCYVDGECYKGQMSIPEYTIDPPKVIDERFGGLDFQ
jgi:hypothetical protein